VSVSMKQHAIHWHWLAKHLVYVFWIQDQRPHRTPATGMLLLLAVAATFTHAVPLVAQTANALVFAVDDASGSIILHSRQIFWEFDKVYIVIVGLSVILIEALLILGLLWQRARRRKVEEKLHTSEEKLAGIVASAMDAIVAVDEEQRIVLFNTAAEKMFGCAAIEAVGTPVDRFIPQRFRSEHEVHIHRFGESGVTNRAIGALGALCAVRANGEEFPIEASISHTEADGRKLFTVIIRDITDRKLAEQALRNLTGELIEAQEDERRRIAREIHDDYNQRLAVLAIDLEELAENIGRLNGDGPRRLRELWNYVSELAADLHALSHSLHSSTLESLGLVAGLTVFCEEFTNQQGVQVKFDYENVPSRIPSDLALCLFRIVQESLRNIKRHSGANQAEVFLERTDEGLRLSVSDCGNGFDPHMRSSNSGIGIRSMQERLRLLGGHLQIFSRLGEGTRIDAWLPLNLPVSV